MSRDHDARPLTSRPLLVLICGPYLSGTDGDPAKIAANRERLESVSLPVYERGHLAVVSEWFALPIFRGAGGVVATDPGFGEFQYPVARRVLERCDAVLRLPGASRGADLDVEYARALGLPIYTDVQELPLRCFEGGEGVGTTRG